MKNYSNKKKDDLQNKRKRLSNKQKEIQIRNKKIKVEQAITKEKLLENDYKKIPEDALSVLSPIIEKVPGLLAEQAIQNAALKTINEAVNGSFRCILDSGLHLAERSGQPNVFLGTGLDNTTNKITAQASWLKNESVFEIPVTPQIISGIFSTLSIVTGQYYMSQINKKLSNLDQRVNSIEERLKDEDISKLIGNLTYLQDISDRISYIQQLNDRIISERNQISNIIRETEGQIVLFHKQIETTVNSLNFSDNKEVFNRNLSKIYYLQICSDLSLRIYMYSHMMYVLMNHVYNSAEIEKIIDKVEKQISINQKWMVYAHDKARNYINQAEVMNHASFREQYEAVKKNIEDHLPYNTPFVLKNKKLEWDNCNDFNNALLSFSNEYMDITKGFHSLVQTKDKQTELIYLDGEWFYKGIVAEESMKEKEMQ